jgi:hypothetical protein
MGGKNGNGTIARAPLASLPKPLPKPIRRGGEDFTSHPSLSNHDARRVGVEALCDPRTVFKYLHGGPQTRMTRERIERALKACGFEHLIGYATQAAAVRAQNERANAKGES